MKLVGNDVRKFAAPMPSEANGRSAPVLGRSNVRKLRGVRFSKPTGQSYLAAPGTGALRG
jgi:hypothetical protein